MSVLHSHELDFGPRSLGFSDFRRTTGLLVSPDPRSWCDTLRTVTSRSDPISNPSTCRDGKSDSPARSKDECRLYKTKNTCAHTQDYFSVHGYTHVHTHVDREWVLGSTHVHTHEWSHNDMWVPTCLRNAKYTFREVGLQTRPTTLAWDCYSGRSSTPSVPVY